MTTPGKLFKVLILSGIFGIQFLTGHAQFTEKPDDNFHFAKQHEEDLRLSVYITAHTVERLLSSAEGRREATSLMMANGITKVYVEVYRSGLVVSPDLLSEVSEYFKQNGFEVVGGIATVPGGDFGVKQEGELGWFNWQNPKTQQDLKQVMTDAAPIFDTFIVDDFLCTGDTSTESKAAKGERSWSAYRRQMLTELATSVFIEPAKSVNPDIHIIIKYPQWYDRFHMFGYDVESGPKLFDGVWVGTETRGQYTQRFGFVQPYEGFVNYSWIKSVAGGKIGGAWFDHGDCDALDFIEQAYQSVLAGADELVIFNYDSFVFGHPGHHLLRLNFEKLIRLAKALKSSPVVHEIAGYKPVNSDAGGDLYIMDFIGMLGIPLIPNAYYPEGSSTIFLPTQAASDPEIVKKVLSSHKQEKRIIMTAGFLARVNDKGKLSKLAGISKPEVHVTLAEKIVSNGDEIILERPLDLEAIIETRNATTLLETLSDNRRIPFLTESRDGQMFVLNTHTFSEENFKEVGEVLLCPRPLGLLDLPTSWANVIRNVFNSLLQIETDAPTRVTLQPLENGDIVLYNYNREEVNITLNDLGDRGFLDVFTNKNIDTKAGTFSMPSRTGIWLRKVNK